MAASLALDHVIALVRDLDATSEELLGQHGLASVEGGRHWGHGTANRIVPLGDTYLELMSVVDPGEAEGSAMGRWALANSSTRLRPAALCLRTDDIESVASAIGDAATPMTRTRPDGIVLRWRLCGLAGVFGPSRLPFFIEWDVGPGDHPGETPIKHEVGVLGFTRVAIGDPGPLRPLLTGVAGLDIGPGQGVHQAFIGTEDSEITLS